MYQSNLIVRTKLAPLRPHKYILDRPRLTRQLLEARHHRLTVVQAGTGYGKSTALGALAGQPYPFVWYRLDPEDTDPQRFLAHLVHGFMARLPGLTEAPLSALEAASNRSTTSWTVVVDTLINDCVAAIDPETTVFLALDDVHHLIDAAVPIRILDRLIGLAPHNLHIILATRSPVTMPTLLAWRVKGEVLEIGETELAFTPDEIDALYRTRYGHQLTLEQAALLVEKVEGWPIALQLVWQNLQQDNGLSFAGAVAQLSGSAGDLFSYLTQEILAQQPEDIQRFLRTTSVLRQMTADSCDYLRAADDSGQILAYLLDHGLFVTDLGEGQLRYHPLFRSLLTQQLSPAATNAAHRRAARYFQERGLAEAAIYHWLAAAAFEEAAVQLDTLGQEMVQVGRLDTLVGWIGSLPADILAQHPSLLTYLGDIARLQSHFDQALGWYQQAEGRSRALGNIPALGQALRGQARVYLDTVNPNQAEQLLQEALRLSDGLDDRESRARLNELMAENLLNLGRPEAARQYQAAARELRQEGPSQVELPVRILLRTGRLGEARRLLEEQAARERQEPVLRPRAHRETLLLLSLILAYQGEQAAAMEAAVEGTKRGQALHSDFVTAVGFMRQGHAWALLKNEAGYREAVRCHEEAIRFSEKLDVPRLKVEACWGLCQAYGFRGELASAAQAAEQGLEIARLVGDEWIAASIRTALGAAYILAGRYDDARPWLTQAGTGFRDCGDTYGQAVNRLWQCLVWHPTGDTARLERDLTVLLDLCQTHGYESLFLCATLLGPPDIRMLVPLLLFARDRQADSSYAVELLGRLGLAELTLHPGYQLRVQTLGQFHLWHGTNEVPYGAWSRKKALQLFLLFLTYRDQILHREQICELLWPELSPDDAVRDFKIAYSALCGVLEPERRRHAPSAFILREGAGYGLRPEADLWLDAAEFERLTDGGDRLVEHEPAAAVPLYQQALALYEGDYLQAYPYYEWCHEEQERLFSRYLRASERLAGALVQTAAWEEAIPVCEAILTRDACWEEAYRLLMLAYEGQGNRVQALRTFERCADTLHDRWGVAPAAETVQTYQAIRQTASPAD